MLNSVFQRKLYYGNETFYCLKDVLYYLQSCIDNDIFLMLIDQLEQDQLYTIDTLEKKYIDYGFKSYIKEDLNNILIEYLKKNNKNYKFVNKEYINSILKKINAKPNYDKKKNNVLNCLKKVFKNENYQIYHSINGLEVEFYLVDYNLIIQQESSYSQYKKEQCLKKELNCTFIHYNIYNKNFDVFNLISKINDFMRRLDKNKYKDHYYYY